MPVDLTNPKLFKPAIPRAPRLHALFGTKNFRAHGFMEGDKWSPQALTTQYDKMVHMLGTHLRYKRLELDSKRRKKEKLFHNLKEQCRGGRLRLKLAQAGHTTLIRNMYSHNQTLQRLYTSMPSSAIVNHADDVTFTLRRERDRLRYEQQQLMHLYEQKLVEKAGLEDRLKYDCDSKTAEEWAIRDQRTELSTSQTRIYVLKAIQRAYRRMIGILSKDEHFFEPVLKSLEDDVVEQEKFIKLTIMLGHPVITEKDQSLRQEFQKMESEANNKVKQNHSLVDSFKKQTAKAKQEMIQTVRKSMTKPISQKKYIRETKSMEFLRGQSEELEKVMKQLQMVTTAGTPKDIYPRFKMTDMILSNGIKDKEFKDTMYSIMSRTEKPVMAMENETKFNFSNDEQERLDEISVLRAKISQQKAVRESEAQKKIQNENNLVIFTKAMYHILDVLRHVDQPMPVVQRVYPSKELELRLLDFEAKPMKKLPPQYRQEDVHLIMNRVLVKIKKMCKPLAKYDAPTNFFPDAVENYRNMYYDKLKHPVSKIKEEEAPEEDGDLKDYANIPTRKQIKQQSARIVEKALEARELEG